MHNRCITLCVTDKMIDNDDAKKNTDINNNSGDDTNKLIIIKNIN